MTHNFFPALVMAFNQTNLYAHSIPTHQPEGGRVSLQTDIDNIRCRLEEAHEAGDLEDRFSLAVELGTMEDTQNHHERMGTKPKFIECGLCHGRGKHEEYREEWECTSCLGLGGFWK